MLIAAVMLLTGVLALAVGGPWIAGDLRGVGLPFTPADKTGSGLLGLDYLGRDTWTALLRGGRPLVVLPLIAVGTTTGVGVALGLALGYLRGRPAQVAQRLLDVILAFPPILVILVLLNGWGTSNTVLITGIVIIMSPIMARTARAAAARITTSPHVELAVAAGESKWMILWREVLPATVVTVTSVAGVYYIEAIFLMSAVGFLGFGGTESWATMISDNLPGARLNIWGVIAPALSIAVLAISANIVADEMARRGDR
jgi:ABC-type dipeptide/oligopeptide/nickel transport system permease subunit